MESSKWQKNYEDMDVGNFKKSFFRRKRRLLPKILTTLIMFLIFPIILELVLPNTLPYSRNFRSAGKVVFSITREAFSAPKPINIKLTYNNHGNYEMPMEISFSDFYRKRKLAPELNGLEFMVVNAGFDYFDPTHVIDHFARDFSVVPYSNFGLHKQGSKTKPMFKDELPKLSNLKVMFADGKQRKISLDEGFVAFQPNTYGLWRLDDRIENHQVIEPNEVFAKFMFKFSNTYNFDKEEWYEEEVQYWIAFQYAVSYGFELIPEKIQIVGKGLDTKFIYPEDIEGVSLVNNKERIKRPDGLVYIQFPQKSKISFSAIDKNEKYTKNELAKVKKNSQIRRIVYDKKTGHHWVPKYGTITKNGVQQKVLVNHSNDLDEKFYLVVPNLKYTKNAMSKIEKSIKPKEFTRVFYSDAGVAVRIFEKRGIVGNIDNIGIRLNSLGEVKVVGEAYESFNDDFINMAISRESVQVNQVCKNDNNELLFFGSLDPKQSLFLPRSLMREVKNDDTLRSYEFKGKTINITYNDILDEYDYIENNKGKEWISKGNEAGEMTYTSNAANSVVKNKNLKRVANLICEGSKSKTEAIQRLVDIVQVPYYSDIKKSLTRNHYQGPRDVAMPFFSFMLNGGGDCEDHAIGFESLYVSAYNNILRNELVATGLMKYKGNTLHVIPLITADWKPVKHPFNNNVIDPITGKTLFFVEVTGKDPVLGTNTPNRIGYELKGIQPFHGPKKWVDNKKLKVAPKSIDRG